MEAEEAFHHRPGKEEERRERGKKRTRDEKRMEGGEKKGETGVGERKA